MKPKTTNDTWQKILVGLFLLFIAGMVAGMVYLMNEPSSRAKRVHQAIRPGTSVEDIESLLTGRYFCFYSVKTTEGWMGLSSRSEFTDAIGLDSTEAMRLNIGFIGFTPYRASMDVEFDRFGNVTSVAKPYSWD